MEDGEYYNYLRYCPECGKHLESNLISGSFACFLHGDFEIIDNRVVWVFSKNLIKRD